MIIFPGKTERTLQGLKITTDFCVVTQEKAWMDKEKMQVGTKKVRLKHVSKDSEDMSFGKSLIVMDAFKAHLMDSVKLAMTDWQYRDHPSTWEFYIQSTAIRCLHQ